MKTQPNTRRGVLACLPDAYHRELLKQCQVRKYARNQQIVEQQSQDRNVYFVDAGKVRVTLYSATGREVSFTDMQRGDNFGELSALDAAVRSASVLALQPSTLTIMPPQVFQRMLSEHPAANQLIYKQLTSMIRRLCERIFEYSTLGIQNRIHAELLRLAKQHRDLDGVARIPHPPTHAELGSRISCHREAVSREMKNLEKQGLVRKHKGGWVIEDWQRLENLVSSFEF